MIRHPNQTNPVFLGEGKLYWSAYLIHRFAITIYLILFTVAFAKAQIPVLINDSNPHQILTFGQVDILEDKEGKLDIGHVLTSDVQNRFKPNRNRIAKNDHLSSVYWYRFKIGHNSASSKKWILEFFDQSIADLQLYVPDGFNSYQLNTFGTNYTFGQRMYNHKNFTYDLVNKTDKLLTYYVRIKSPTPASAIFVVRDLRWFVAYALSEYFIFGLFYGMIIVFCLYNLLMFFAVKGKQYLYYVVYNLSIGLYEMCNDGIAFQYLWPKLPQLNLYGFGTALFLSSVFGMLFTAKFLYLESKSPRIYKTILLAIGLRTLFFISCLINPTLFNLKLLEFIPLMLVFYAGISLFRKGYRPALFLVIGYGFLITGFIVKILLLLKWIPYGALSYYSLSICFILEMVLVSFAIGYSIRSLRKKQARAQKRIIKQLRINEQLNKDLNSELSSMVNQRTLELKAKAEIIAQQNAEISEMNALLKNDNRELKLNIEKVTKARVMSKVVDFEEFCKIYPDKDSCFKYISELKWREGYSCRKCGNAHYLAGQTLFARRCTKCGYDESVTAYTLFQNSRIPINKAMYMLFLVYNSKGTISSHKLSQILSIRQSTCWTYNSKMQRILDERKDEIKAAGKAEWSMLVLDGPMNLSYQRSAS